MSCEHSGSTLLAFILASHPQMASVGELVGNIPYDKPYKCSCGKLIRECPFWCEVIDRISRFGFSVDIGHFGINIPDPNQKNILLDILFRHYPYKFLEKFKIFILKHLPFLWQDICYRTQKNVAFAKVICDIENASIF